MKNALHSLAQVLGLEKLSQYEKDYLLESNLHGSMYIGFITVALEIWMIVRQLYSKVIPKCDAGMDFFAAMVKYTTKFWLFLLVGLAVALFCLFCGKYKNSKMTRGWFWALLLSGGACVLYAPVLSLEAFTKVSDSVTQTMADIMNTLLIALYAGLLVLGLTIVCYAWIRYRKSRRAVWLEHMMLITFAAICMIFGYYVSYSDFWSGRDIICFMMMMIYVGYAMVYRPWITILLMVASFAGFYAVLQTYQGGLSFGPKEVVIRGVTHWMTSGDTTNYLTFLVSLVTIFIATYHGRLKEIRNSRRVYRLFDQTAEALTTAIDAKDEYTHGHSARVADYSVKLARGAGKSDEECEKIYYAALLHDVGKIGVPDYIINKDGRLTNEEFEQIKLHPVHGNKILSRISEWPYLSIGAHYHHERYDGRGYPDRLKGEDIPEIARIIAVADAYDAMTSKRSYRDPLPQQKVREEIYKGIGTQFDPAYAHEMIGFIDADTAYTMQEGLHETDQTGVNRLICGELYGEYTDGMELDDHILRITMYSKPEEGGSEKESLPSLVLFDSLDRQIHPEDERKQADLLYMEYARIRMDGEVFRGNVRRMAEQRVEGSDMTMDPDANTEERGLRYDVQVVRQKDHILVHAESMYQTLEITLALPDSTHFAYLAITGSHCAITSIRVTHDVAPVPRGYIARIAPEISYIESAPVGDLANLQINGWRTESSGGILLGRKTVITFHTRSLPMARLVWHCPFILLFTSDNALVNGEHYQEYSLIRLDGETWQSNEHAENHIESEQTAAFKGWNEWKAKLKEGIDITVTICRDGKTVTIETENLGLSLRARTTVLDHAEDIYAAITGDECTVTDIHVIHENAQKPDDPKSNGGPGEHEGRKRARKNVQTLLHREEG